MGSAARKLAEKGKDPVSITITTGDAKYAGTDNDVVIRFIDEGGTATKPFLLDNFFHDDFERGRTDEFALPDVGGIGDISIIEIWREGYFDDGLFLNVISVFRLATGVNSVFPVHRWIPLNVPLVLKNFDSYLPQDDHDRERREDELTWKRAMYQMSPKAPGLPSQCIDLPEDQAMSSDYQWDLRSRKRKAFVVSRIKSLTVSELKCIEDLKKLYTTKTLPLPKPALNNWFLRDDYFAEQRLSGCNPSQIKLCTQIPDNFAVTKELVEPFLEGKSLEDTLNAKKLFLTDYAILDKLQITNPKLHLVAPLGLFYLNDAGTLLPVAIQLQQIPADDNPVFVPSDPKYTWMMSKLWMNLADASVHQAKIHLGFTHLIAETFCVVTHRQLSPSHPIFRLLAPHFLFLLAINHLALGTLVSAGGWIDQTMTVGRLGIFDIIRRSNATWRLDLHGTLPEDIKDRGVGADVLPHYPYRDDAMELFEVIRNYVREVVDSCYGGSIQRLEEDWEVQAWAKELSMPTEESGAGVKGLPGGGSLTSFEDLICILTSIIFTSSVQHAAVNFCQYDQYSFPLVYPSLLLDKPPTSKKAMTEDDILHALPPRGIISDTMIVSHILSAKGTNSLGDFEVQYLYNDYATAALAKLREQLKTIGERFAERNQERTYSYCILDPAGVPNAISI